LRAAVVRPLERRDVGRAIVRDVAVRLLLDDARLPRALVLRVEAERLDVDRREVERPDVLRPEALRDAVLRAEVPRDVLRPRPVPLLCRRDDDAARVRLLRFAPRFPVLRVPALRLCDPRALVRDLPPAPAARPRPLARRPRGCSPRSTACAVSRLMILLKLLFCPRAVVS
jgi:hypothetical protein